MGTVRRPRAFLVINGMRLLCLKADCSSSSTRNADTFSAELSLAYTSGLGMDAGWWSDQDKIDAQMVFSVGGFGEKMMISGGVDEITIDLIDGCVSVSGRDKSAQLSEKRRSKKFNNQKSSDIVSEIASDNGLTPVIETTGDDAGKQYHQDTVHLALNATDFETLSALAEREGARWYVKGDELHFVPKDSSEGAYPLIYRDGSYKIANFEKLTMKRNLRADKPVKVKVKSWHHKDAKVYEHTEETGGSDGTPLEFEHHVAMANQAQVEKIAKSKMNDVLRHELSLDITIPGDLNIDASQKLILIGTDSAFDQEYDIDHIKFTIGEDGGFEMSINTKAPKKGRGK
jgi:phage protein D